MPLIADGGRARDPVICSFCTLKDVFGTINDADAQSGFLFSPCSVDCG
jgi:hypothetical protein